MSGDGRTFSLEDQGFDDIIEVMQSMGQAGGKALTNYFKTEVGPMVQRRIDALMPSSGRTFKGHSSGAKGSAWQRYRPDGLSVEVGTTAARRYLYFPDDGSNTINHAGNQRFFERGAEAAGPEVADGALEALMREWSGS